MSKQVHSVLSVALLSQEFDQQANAPDNSKPQVKADAQPGVMQGSRFAGVNPKCLMKDIEQQQECCRAKPQKIVKKETKSFLPSLTGQTEIAIRQVNLAVQDARHSVSYAQHA